LTAGGAPALLFGQLQQQQQLQQRRYLNLYEYQSMQLLQQHNVAVPRFRVASTPEEAQSAAAALQQELLQQQPQQQQQQPGLVVKAQVLAGGRGLGYFKENGYKGGVQRCSSPQQVFAAAANMLQKTLVTKQTGAAGKVCNTILICEEFKAKRELYLAIILDRNTGVPMLIASSQGGTSIEDIAHSNPQAIKKIRMGFDEALSADALEELRIHLNLSPSMGHQLKSLISSLHNLFISRDCLLVEINPLILTDTPPQQQQQQQQPQQELWAADAKLSVDDNAKYRQLDLFESVAAEEKAAQQNCPAAAAGGAAAAAAALEAAAEEQQLQYVKLGAGVGCLVNGAGLAMATMDLLQLRGGAAANFLDLGGAAAAPQIALALQLLRSDAAAPVLFLNIFAGILKCDEIAKGLVQAAREHKIHKPIV
ncbi:succinyl-CoA ligase, putative, partial [Eimeria tenella]